MRVLVTGGAGFIGSNFTRFLLEHSDDHVTVLDALTYAGHLSNLEPYLADTRLTVVVGDVGDRQLLRSLLPSHDAIVHFAAESHVDRSLISPDAFVRTNCIATSTLCDVAVEVGVERMLHVSTDEVYGEVLVGSANEDSLLRPTSTYAASKATSDLIALARFHSHHLPVVISRSTNQFGPRQYPEKLVPFFITTLLAGGSLPLHGDGSSIRDWLFVDDNCAALDLLLRRGQPGTVYNIGSGLELSNLCITKMLLDLLDADASRIRLVQDRPGQDRRYSVDSGRIRRLGWIPETPIDEALERTVDWYRRRPDYWRRLLDETHRFHEALRSRGHFRPIEATPVQGAGGREAVLPS